MLNFCTNFYKNAWFGGYPNECQFQELVQDVKISEFLDLTTIKERQYLEYNYEYDLQKYQEVKYQNFCILDNKIPSSTDSFVNLLRTIAKQIENGDCLYIHCKGGHGRSSLLVACLLMYLNSYSIEVSLQKTKYFHKQRKNLKEKYKDIDVPSSSSQRKYIDTIFHKLKE